ncbi:MAG: phosphoglucosamine mutase [Phycisphaerae bacterium]
MPLIRSVSGVRGIARASGTETVTMDVAVARRMGRAYATYLREGTEGRRDEGTKGRRDEGTEGVLLRAGAWGSEGLTLVGSRDGRAGGDALLSAFADGARASGVAMLELGIVSTPGLAMTVQALSASGGVVITASHNPAEWNGIKLMTAQGRAVTGAEADAIFRIFDRDASGTGGQAAGGTRYHDAGVREGILAPAGMHARKDSRTSTLDPHQHHVETVLKIVDVQRICDRSFSVVLDSINGAGATAGRMLLERLGCSLVQMNPVPATEFAHRPEPVEANLGDLCRRVREGTKGRWDGGTKRVDVGFAQDPDADRLVLVDEAGRFVGEEYTLVLCAKRVFATHPGPVAVNLSTSRMIDDVAAAAGDPCRVYRSAVGEANVVEVMQARDCAIGGEGNGGVIDPRVVYVRDSLVGMALTLDLLAAEGKSLSQVVFEVPRYVMLKNKITCNRSRIARSLAAVRSAFGDGRVNDVDGVRVDWREAEQWLHVRGSNTEPVVRIIVEAADWQAAARLMSRAGDVVGQAAG